MKPNPSGIIFDIKEFAVHDGPGIRTTVFLKGCPLRCAWCHNPEGLSPRVEETLGTGHARRTGRSYRADELAHILNGQAEVLREAGGGITFSGGEPLMQPEFLLATVDRLDCLHVLLDTCGHARSEIFADVVRQVDLVHFDLKLVSPARHKHYTGVDNTLIMKNLHILEELGCPCVLRVPLVPGVTDTPENLASVAACAAELNGLVRVDLLPYNRAAGAKYAACGRRFTPEWDEQAEVNADTDAFARLGVPVKVRQ